MTLLIAFIINFGSLLIMASIKGFTSLKKLDMTDKQYQELGEGLSKLKLQPKPKFTLEELYWKTQMKTQMESVIRLGAEGRDRDRYGKLTSDFIDRVYSLHVMTWKAESVQRRSMAQRIRKYGTIPAINLRPIYMNKPRIGKKQK